jgi:hypothetical protein
MKLPLNNNSWHKFRLHVYYANFRPRLRRDQDLASVVQVSLSKCPRCYYSEFHLQLDSQAHFPFQVTIYHYFPIRITFLTHFLVHGYINQ